VTCTVEVDGRVVVVWTVGVEALTVTVVGTTIALVEVRVPV
jgi:hypothetical protein